MTQEEKAKRYDEALHKAKNYYSTTDSSSDIKLIGLIFPELKESEDEKVRKEIIYHIQYCDDTIDEVAEKRMIAWLEKQGEQKSAWSEEDETILANLIYALANDRIGNNRDEYVDWLKSLKDRVKPKQKQGWGEDDERMVTRIIESLSAYADKLQYEGFCHNKTVIQEYISWLKSLRLQVAKHFFELGLRSTITEEDCKLIWNIGDDLLYMPEEDFFKELLRRYKAQKGEEV